MVWPSCCPRVMLERGECPREHRPVQQSIATVATTGIDIGYNSFQSSAAIVSGTASNHDITGMRNVATAINVIG